LVQQREAIWDAPMFNKLPVAETTNVHHVDADRLARTRIGASGPATGPNSILRFYKGFEGELKVFDAPSRVFDLRFSGFLDQAHRFSTNTRARPVALRIPHLQLTNLRARSRAQLWT
jgi:hypothetical protein